MQVAIHVNPESRADLAAAIALLNRFLQVNPEVPPLVPGATLDAADRPDAGVDTPSPGQAFGATAGVNPAAAFGAGVNPAAAFGAGEGNGQPAQVPMSGAQPSIAAMPQTTPPGLPALPTGSQPGVPSAPGSVPAPAPAGSTNIAPVDTDKDGLPWDARIHASTKGKNQDGRWKKKRGVSDAEVGQVEAQLRALMAAPGPNAHAPQSVPAPTMQAQPSNFPSVPTPPSTVPQPPHVNTGSYTSSAPTGATVPPGVPGGATPQSAPSAAASPAQYSQTAAGSTTPPPTNFVDLIGKFAPMLQSGALSQDEAKTACMQHGVAELALLSSRPDLVGAVNATLDAILAAKAAMRPAG